MVSQLTLLSVRALIAKIKRTGDLLFRSSEVTSV